MPSRRGQRIDRFLFCQAIVMNIWSDQLIVLLGAGLFIGLGGIAFAVASRLCPLRIEIMHLTPNDGADHTASERRLKAYANQDHLTHGLESSPLSVAMANPLVVAAALTAANPPANGEHAADPRGPTEAWWDQLPDGCYFCSATGQLFQANRALARLLGYGSAAEILASGSQSVREWYRDANRFAQLGEQLREQRRLENCRSAVKTRGGETLWWNEHLRGQFDEAGKLVGYFATVRTQFNEEAACDQANAKSRNVWRNPSAAPPLPTARHSGDANRALRHLRELLDLLAGTDLSPKAERYVQSARDSTRELNNWWQLDQDPELSVMGADLVTTAAANESWNALAALEFSIGRDFISTEVTPLPFADLNVEALPLAELLDAAASPSLGIQITFASRANEPVFPATAHESLYAEPTEPHCESFALITLPGPTLTCENNCSNSNAGTEFARPSAADASPPSTALCAAEIVVNSDLEKSAEKSCDERERFDFLNAAEYCASYSDLPEMFAAEPTVVNPESPRQQPPGWLEKLERVESLLELALEPTTTNTLPEGELRLAGARPKDDSRRRDDGAVDWQALLQRCLGDVDFARRMLARFTERVPKVLSALDQALGERDFTGAARCANLLRGIASNLAAEKLRVLVADLEAACREGSELRADQLLREVRGETQACLDYVQQLESPDSPLPPAGIAPKKMPDPSSDENQAAALGCEVG